MSTFLRSLFYFIYIFLFDRYHPLRTLREDVIVEIPHLRDFHKFWRKGNKIYVASTSESNKFYSFQISDLKKKKLSEYYPPVLVEKKDDSDNDIDEKKGEKGRKKERSEKLEWNQYLRLIQLFPELDKDRNEE